MTEFILSVKFLVRVELVIVTKKQMFLCQETVFDIHVNYEVMQVWQETVKFMFSDTKDVNAEKVGMVGEMQFHDEERRDI